MANEATVQSGLTIRRGNQTHQTQPNSFRADVSGLGGPTPGTISVPTAGVDVDFSKLTTPGLCRIQNLDTTNYITYGIWDPNGYIFYPLGEVLPGESYVIRLSRIIQSELVGTGYGTDTDVNRLRIIANTAACMVLIEAFDK